MSIQRAPFIIRNACVSMEMLINGCCFFFSSSVVSFLFCSMRFANTRRCDEDRHKCRSQNGGVWRFDIHIYKNITQREKERSNVTGCETIETTKKEYKIIKKSKHKVKSEIQHRSKRQHNRIVSICVVNSRRATQRTQFNCIAKRDIYFVFVLFFFSFYFISVPFVVCLFHAFSSIVWCAMATAPEFEFSTTYLSRAHSSLFRRLSYMH